MTISKCCFSWFFWSFFSMTGLGEQPELLTFIPNVCEKPGSCLGLRHHTAPGWWQTVQFWEKSTQRRFTQPRIILATM